MTAYRSKKILVSTKQSKAKKNLLSKEQKLPDKMSSLTFWTFQAQRKFSALHNWELLCAPGNLPQIVQVLSAELKWEVKNIERRRRADVVW